MIIETRFRKDLRVAGTGLFKLELNGWIRTIVHNFTINDSSNAVYDFNLSFDYRSCGSPEEMIGGKLYIQVRDASCVVAHNTSISLDDGIESDIRNICNPLGMLKLGDLFLHYNRLRKKLRMENVVYRLVFILVCAFVICLCMSVQDVMHDFDTYLLILCF